MQRQSRRKASGGLSQALASPFPEHKAFRKWGTIFPLIKHVSIVSAEKHNKCIFQLSLAPGFFQIYIQISNQKGLPWGLIGKESPFQAGHVGLILW